ncbi:MAG: orotidine-5-phosphate decarboxylase [Bacteroidota bacterium]
MNLTELIAIIQQRKSFLCVGLDTDLSKIPAHLLHSTDPIFEFNKQIIDATRNYCVAYKPNTAFYEANGSKGWESLQKTVDYIGSSHFIIADAKRGDIGNTAQQYAKAFFENMNCDSVTISPYMGGDAITPFLKYENKFAIVLALTSNEGAKDFQFLTDNNQPLYEQVIKKSAAWGNEENIMFVVGATKPEYFKHIRAIAPKHFLLVPGVGAQGGTVEDVCQYGLAENCGLLINVSREIIYASNQIDFAEKAGAVAQKYQQIMSSYL